jgi:hypothetical protein
MQFGGSSGFGSLGLLRFSSPRRAWLFDLQGSGGHTHTSANTFTSQATPTARLGRRFYQLRATHIASFQTLGISGVFQHQCSNGICTNGWTAGVFGGLGGAYLLTPHLSIGGEMGIQVAYGYTRSKSYSPFLQTISRTWSTHVALQGPTFGATIYF